MALDIGKEWSVYYDFNKSRRDSTRKANFRPNKFSLSKDVDALQNRLEMRNEVYGVLDESRDETMRIFKNRKSDEIIVFDKGPLEVYDTFTNFKLTEIISPQQWEISDDTLTVLGYVCNKATASFRGREFHAWFTVDIPISEGPWKLYGLPGLILQVEDKEGLFQFESIGLQKVNMGTVAFPTDKKVVICKNLKDLIRFRKERFKTISIGFDDGNRDYTYYRTKNPINYYDLELEY